MKRKIEKLFLKNPHRFVGAFILLGLLSSLNAFSCEVDELFEAVKKDDVAIVEISLTEGLCDFDHKNSKGQSLLNIAAKYRAFKTAKVLLEFGNKVDNADVLQVQSSDERSENTRNLLEAYQGPLFDE